MDNINQTSEQVAKELAEKLRKEFKGKVATSVASYGPRVAVRYHATDVFVYNVSNGDVILDNGGWFTATTKERMNVCLQVSGLSSFGVFQETRRPRKGEDVKATKVARRHWFLRNRHTGLKYPLDVSLHFNAFQESVAGAA